MPVDIQPLLENEDLLLQPLKPEHFDALYKVASDPAVWVQHPNKDRWQKDVFQNFFEGALQSGGAYIIFDKATGEVAGSTRFYDYSREKDSIFIGYTFYGTRYWGKGLNPAVKTLMLNYVFTLVSKVYFQIGASNVRSQVAITRLGARKIGEEEVAYYGEPVRLNFLYLIEKEDWVNNIG